MTARQRSSRRRRISRAARRAAQRGAVRPAATARGPVYLEPAAFARRLVELGVQTHVGFDADGNLEQIPIDPDVFAAEVARMDTHPHDPDQTDDVLYEAPGTDLDDDCPICRALRVAAVGPADRRWSLD